jgi:hypothetical protein
LKFLLKTWSHSHICIFGDMYIFGIFSRILKYYFTIVVATNKYCDRKSVTRLHIWHYTSLPLSPFKINNRTTGQCGFGPKEWALLTKRPISRRRVALINSNGRLL